VQSLTDIIIMVMATVTLVIIIITIMDTLDITTMGITHTTLTFISSALLMTKQMLRAPQIILTLPRGHHTHTDMETLYPTTTPIIAPLMLCMELANMTQKLR
jgi:hypothetical protein